MPRKLSAPPIDPISVKDYQKAKADLEKHEPSIRKRVEVVAEILDTHRALCCEKYWPNTSYNREYGLDDGGAISQEGMDNFSIQGDKVRVEVTKIKSWGLPCPLKYHNCIAFTFPTQYLFDDKYFEKELKEVQEFERKREEEWVANKAKDKQWQEEQERKKLAELKAKYE